MKIISMEGTAMNAVEVPNTTSVNIISHKGLEKLENK